MSQTYKLTLTIRRYDPDEGKSWDQTYELEAGAILRFVDLFRRINVEQDATLTWASSCEHGQCGGCSVRINGRPMLASELLEENAVHIFGSMSFRIEPVAVAPVVRDLAVDWEKAYERVHRAKPYVIKPIEPPAGPAELRISPKELARYEDAARCLNCFCCATVCISAHRSFIGPNAVVASVIRLMDVREQEKDERLALLNSEEGVYRCHTSKACTHVCPKHIDIAHFIALAKEGAF